MSRRTKAEIAADEAAELGFQRLHARAAADRIAANPDTIYSARYQALTAMVEAQS